MVFGTKSGPEVRKYRLSKDMDQGSFWRRISVTQSGGSRYETGREMPEQVAMMLTIAYGEKREAERLVAKLRNGGPH